MVHPQTYIKLAQNRTSVVLHGV